MVDPLGVKAVQTSDRSVAPVAPVAQPSRVAAVAEPSNGDQGVVASSALSAVAKELASEAPVDTDRVARIRKAIADGNFPIYPATIADRLIALKLDWHPHDAS